MFQHPIYIFYAICCCCFIFCTPVRSC